jgi:predicted lipoprotein with Yx(FWY)xxD motif
MRVLLTSAIAAALAMSAGAVLAQPPGLKTVNTFSVNADGLNLYTADSDTTAGKSMCNAGCATVWPPYTAGADAKPAADWTVIVRDDGSKQWAYKGKPVYMFSRDAAGRSPMGTSVQGWNLVK